MAAGDKNNPIREKTVVHTPNSAAPSIKSLTRNGDKFTLTWARGSTHGKKAYVSQDVKFRRKIASGSGAAVWQDWKDNSVTATATSSDKTYQISTSYWPKTSTRLTAVQAEVRGKEGSYMVNSSKYKKSNGKYYYILNVYNPEWSAYEKKLFDLDVPYAPVLGAVIAAGNDTSTSVAYNVAADTLRPYTWVEYQTALVQNFGNATPTATNVSWGASAHTPEAASGTITIPESSPFKTGQSWSRVIRARSRGASGDSAWVYKNLYVYATPYSLPASNITVSLADEGSGHRVSYKFNAYADSNHPVDSFTLEYCIGIPKDQNMTLPDSAGWQTAASDIPYAGTVSNSFTINTRMTDEQAVWVRVLQKHGTHTSVGAAKYVTGSFRGVKSMADGAVTVSAYDARVQNGNLTLQCSVSSQSSIPNAIVKIYPYYKSGGRWIHEGTILTMAHNATSITTTMNLNGHAEWDFRAWVYSGSLFSAKASSNLYRPRLSASHPEPYFPTNVRVTTGPTPGSLHVAWTNQMEQTTGVTIGVATSAEEWELDNPDIEEIQLTGQNLSSANVGTFEYGASYFVKVKCTNAQGTSNWSSDMGSISLEASLAPSPNSLKATETADHNILLSWNWNDWDSAKKINFVCSEYEDAGKSSVKEHEYQVNRQDRTGPDAYTIRDLDRGRVWHIWASYETAAGVEGPSERRDCNLPVTPIDPADVTAVREAQTTDEAGKSTVLVSWSNEWEDTDKTVVTYSDAVNAWDYSTPPTSVSLERERGKATSVLVPNLQMGKTWYFKVQTSYLNDEFKSNNVPSPPFALDLMTDPAKPVVSVSVPRMSEHGKTDISWTYSCEDGGAQASAVIVILDEDDNEIGSETITGTETAWTLYGDRFDGLVGNYTYYAKVKTNSAYNRESEWSEPTPFFVQHKPIASIDSTSLVDGVLTDLPLTVTVSGTESLGIATVYVERAQSSFEATPDERGSQGYEGELIALKSRSGDGSVDITADDLRGRLNDGALFRIVVFVTDDLGKSDPVTEEFTVAWTHQAILPEVTREADENAMIVKLTATEPEGYAAGDTIDIYRLSADRPELIVENGSFDTTYVDPYPAFGEMGGHRIVYKTGNGDITTADGALAWIDVDGSAETVSDTDVRLDSSRTVISFDDTFVALEYNLELGHSWEKDFTETQYLGGSVQGDWNPAVSRKMSVSTVMVSFMDEASIRLMRRLAVWDGICHVRTPDGSSFAADVQVSENRTHSNGGKIISFSLDITKVDSEALDGMTLAEWEGRTEPEDDEE